MKGGPTAGDLWLTIPWSDYEAHMDHPAVGQLAFLREVLGEVLTRHRPESIVVAGCATGNGFDRIDPGVTTRVVGIDINPDYVAEARRRHAASIPGLDLRCEDLAECEIDEASIDLVFAGLIFEYVEPDLISKRFAAWLRPGGILAAVLQRPARSNVSNTPIESVRCLEPVIHLVEPSTLDRFADACGLDRARADERTLASGKAFAVIEYVRR